MDSEATILCKSCGLCCSGHLFAWVKLRSPELVPIESLGVSVVRHPAQRGFSQPCPLWQGICTIYESAHYPRACGTYKCKLLKRLLDGSVALPEALTVVRHAKQMSDEVESLLPASADGNLRERLVAYLEGALESTKPEDMKFRQKATALLHFYREQFDVKDIFDISEAV